MVVVPPTPGNQDEVPVYTFASKFGTQGNGDGEFQDPHDIGFNADGTLWVTDRIRNDLQKFTAAGVFITKFGSSGSGDGQLNVPYSADVDASGNIYVCDRDNNRVQKFSSTGTFISKITTVNGQALDHPEDIAFDKTNGDIYICDTGNDRIVKLTSAHSFILEWGSTGSGEGEFEHPHSINTDATGNVYVSCGDLPQIQKFTSTGSFIKRWGREGNGPGEVQMFLEHMDIDVFGRIHLVNNDSKPIINVWDLEGNWLTFYGKTTSGSANGQFKEPEHITCDSNGRPYVVDAKNFRVQIFDVSPTTTGAGSPGSSGVSSGIGDNFCMFIDPNTEHPEDEVQIALAPEGINGVMETIANINTEPANVEWLLAPTYNQGAFIGTMKPGDFHGFWLRRVLNITREELKRNLFDINIAFDPPRGTTGGGSGSGGGGGGGGPTPGPAPSDLDLAFAGDWSTSSNAEDTVDNILNFPTVKYIFDTGDHSYESTGGNWADIIKPLMEGGRTMYITMGNHEYEDASGLVSFYKNLFNLDKTYYSVIVGPVLVVVADMYQTYTSGSTQYNFIKKAMEDNKNNSSIKWRIFVYHEPMYSSPSHYNGTAKMRDTYHPLMDANKFDFGINGHNHNFERMKPLRYNNGSPSSPTINDAGAPNYINPNGVIFFQVGNAGRSSHRSFDSQKSFSAYQNDSSFGFLMISLSNNGNTATCKFYRNDHDLMDSCSVTKT